MRHWAVLPVCHQWLVIFSLTVKSLLQLNLTPSALVGNLEQFYSCLEYDLNVFLQL